MRTDPEIDQLMAAVAGHLGARIHDERLRKHWTLRELGVRAGVSASLVHRLESGRPGGLESYVRVAGALGLRLDFDFADPRRRSVIRAEESGPRRARRVHRCAVARARLSGRGR